MIVTFDPTVEYDGPQANFATITGTPWWGMTRQEVLRAMEQRGWRQRSSRRINTPYGLGPHVEHLETADGRTILWIPTYGWALGQDWIERRPSDKLFWILWQAGVKVLIVGGTSGVAEWRDGQEMIQPGDIVLPWSFRTRPFHRGLPYTEYETSWPKYDLLLDEPFCPELSESMAGEAEEQVEEGRVRKVHTPRDVRTAIVHPDGMTFETDFDILMWSAIARNISTMQPDLPPVVTLHGDCENPVLARLLAIHVLYYHTIGNVAQGLTKDRNITDSLYRLLTDNFREATLEMEMELLEKVRVPSGENCKCLSSLVEAPPVFGELYTR